MEIAVDRSLRHWWVFLLRGILFVVLGIYMICSPATGFAALGFLFGLMILLTGIAELLHVTRSRSSRNRGWHLMLGIIDILLGIILMGHVAAGEVILRIIVGIWFLLRGISLLSFSGLIGRSWLITLGGIVTIIFAALILFNPVFGAITIVLWTAIAFIIIGIFNVLLAFRLKSVS
jgi:uncharacterized membrane protein HdeD (DUF308 family)